MLLKTYAIIFDPRELTVMVTALTVQELLEVTLTELHG